MKYKVGDKVRIRGNLKVGERYGDVTFIEHMKKYAGKTMTVRTCVSGGDYCLIEDAGKWYWTDEMLEDVESISILVAGNKVIAKKDNKVGIAKCSPEDEFDIFVGAKLAFDRLEEKYKPYGWLTKGVKYYFPRVDTDKLYNYYQYDSDSDEVDKRLINRGLVFKTKEEAVAVAKKMLAVLKEDEDDERD